MADILQAIELIESWTADEPHNDLYRSAVLRQLGIIGEAAANLGEAFRAAHPEIAWRQVVAQRNNLIHGYWDTEWAMVEETIARDLPELRKAFTPPPPRTSGPGH